MQLLGIFFALGAGLFFGILAPTTKISYNLGLMDEYVEYISNLEILCSVECDALNNLKALAN